MIYFDMDGVLVRYELDAYLGDEPTFTQVGLHYFRDLKPDPMAIELFKKLYKQFKSEVFVCTAVSAPRIIRNEQTFDKMEWMLNYVPDFEVGSNFIATSSNKWTIISSIRGRNLSRSDILIDDYNPNLFSWVSHGGTGIKWINGLNSPESWPGASLNGSDSIDKIITDFNNIWYKLAG